VNVDRTKVVLLLFFVFAMILLLVMPLHGQEKYKIWELILFLIGLGLVFIAVKKLHILHQASSWEKTEAKVLHTEVKIDNPMAREFVWSYYPYIRYQYYVNRREYISDHVAFYRELRDNRSDVERYIKQLIKLRLYIYYDPRDPQKSIIVKTLPFSRKMFWYFFMLLGIGSIYIGFV